jgi:hypothetical protein
MNRSIPIAIALIASIAPRTAHAQELIQAKDGSGYFGHKHTPVQPWSGFHVHDPDRPAPPRVDPGPAGPPTPVPSDAVVLFDGKNLDAFQKSDWTIRDGAIVAGSGALTSTKEFGPCQIHVEWRGPADYDGPWYNAGNSGVNLMGVYEIQIFDSYNQKIYPDGMTAAIYGQTPPLVNAARPPGQWQTLDIVFIPPVFDGDKLVKAPRATVFHNGLLAQLDEEIHGQVAHAALPKFTVKKSTGPFALGGHNCPVEFRNVWVRPL